MSTASLSAPVIEKRGQQHWFTPITSWFAARLQPHPEARFYPVTRTPIRLPGKLVMIYEPCSGSLEDVISDLRGNICGPGGDILNEDLLQLLSLSAFDRLDLFNSHSEHFSPWGTEMIVLIREKFRMLTIWPQSIPSYRDEDDMPIEEALPRIYGRDYKMHRRLVLPVL